MSLRQICRSVYQTAALLQVPDAVFVHQRSFPLSLTERFEVHPVLLRMQEDSLSQVHILTLLLWHLVLPYGDFLRLFLQINNYYV